MAARNEHRTSAVSFFIILWMVYLNVFFQLHNYFIELIMIQGNRMAMTGNDDQQFDQRESPPGLAEIKIREDALANRFYCFQT